MESNHKDIELQRMIANYEMANLNLEIQICTNQAEIIRMQMERLDIKQAQLI